MYFLFSGEGATDFGHCRNGDNCDAGTYDYGPMAVIVDHVAKKATNASLLDGRQYGYVSEKHLSGVAKALSLRKKSPRLTGKRNPKETGYYYRNARALAVCANKKRGAVKCPVIAVLFRDADGTASAGRGEWQHKWDSMINGFQAEAFESGVPMIPKPISEAWIICAVKKNSYQNCDALENRSGSRHSKAPLKDELQQILGRDKLPTRLELRDMVHDRTIDVDRIQMPSFLTFRKRLEEVLEQTTKQAS